MHECHVEICIVYHICDNILYLKGKRKAENNLHHLFFFLDNNNGGDSGSGADESDGNGHYIT